jgi:hypothetical protein
MGALNAQPIDEPWRTDPMYGGMSPESAFASWQAAQARRSERVPEEDVEHADPPPPAGPEDYGLECSQAAGNVSLLVGASNPSFRPTAIDAVEMPDAPAWLIDQILPARGLAAIVGAPKTGKSYFTSDMTFALARGVSYGGRATMHGSVYYLAGEGQNGFRRRLIALRRHHGVEGAGVPFFMIDRVPDLGSEKTDVAELLRDVDQFIADGGHPAPAAIVLDTLARSMGEGDENTAKEMGRFVNRCGIIERHFGCVVIVVHHQGKDPSRGGRGSNALNGAADVTLAVEKIDGCSKVRVVESKDGPEGIEWRFHLKPYDLSATLEHGGATGGATSTCVVELLSEPTSAQPRATSAKKTPSGVAGDLLKVIRRAINEAGKINVESAQVPNNVRAVSRSELRSYCAAMAWQDEAEPNAFRAMLSKTLSQLRAADHIGYDKDWVWLV